MMPGGTVKGFTFLVRTTAVNDVAVCVTSHRHSRGCCSQMLVECSTLSISKLQGGSLIALHIHSMRFACLFKVAAMTRRWIYTYICKYMSM